MIMEYYFSKIVNQNFEEAIQSVTEALKIEGFGIVSTIDMQAKLKEKLNVDYRKYTILGACNPSYAYKTLMLEEKIGVMLPCNVVVIDRENGTTEGRRTAHGIYDGSAECSIGTAGQGGNGKTNECYESFVICRKTKR